LGGPFPVSGHTCPVIRPGSIFIGSQCNHRLDSEAHALFCLAYSLILGVMWDIWRAMKQAIDTVATIRLDHTTAFRLGMLFYNVAVISEESSRLDELDSFI
jgi:hypothetical protein